MKMKAKDITKNLTNLIPLAEKHMPVDVMLAIVDNIEVLKEKTETIEEMRKKIVDRYVLKDENGNAMTVKTETGERYDIPDSKVTAFEAEYAELLESELEVQITMIGVKRLEKMDTDYGTYDSLTGVDLMTLRFMLIR